MMLDLDADSEELAAKLVQAFGDVRHELGAGLLEAIYVECLVEELLERGHRVETEVNFPVTYKGRPLKRTCRVDMMVDDRVIIECKAVEALHPAHYAQFLTYLKMSGKELGFLVNFKSIPLGHGIHRRVMSRGVERDRVPK